MKGGVYVLDFLLYCDLSTMSCTTADINLELYDFAKSFVQINDSLWLFKYPSGFNGSPLQKPNYLFLEYFEKFTNDDSVIFIQQLDGNDYYSLPDEACEFIS